MPGIAWDNEFESIMSTDSVPESNPAPELPEGHSEQSAPSAAHPAADPEPVSEPLVETPEKPPAEESAEPAEDFADILQQFERSHSHKSASGTRQLDGTVISLTAEQVFLDIGYKIEGVLPRSAFRNNAAEVKPGDKVPVSIKGRSDDGLLELSLFSAVQRIAEFFVVGHRVAAPNALKLSDRLWEPAPAGRKREQAGAVRGATPAGAQAVAGGVTGAAPAAVASPQTFTPGWEAVRCSALLGVISCGSVWRS